MLKHVWGIANCKIPNLREFVTKTHAILARGACWGGTELQSVDRIRWIVWIVWTAWIEGSRR